MCQSRCGGSKGASSTSIPALRYVASFTGQLVLWPGNKASPEAPVHKEAFCTTHSEEAAAVSIPTGLKDYIAYCGVKEVIRT